MAPEGGVRSPSRRAVLRTGALIAAAAATTSATGCGLFGDDEPDPTPDPLTPLISGALDLAARHEAAAASDPELAERLQPIAQAHRAHAAELARVTGTALPSGTPTSSGPPSGGTGLAGLRGAEKQGQEAAVQACAVAPAKHAALVGSIAAARATHVEALR